MSGFNELKGTPLQKKIMWRLAKYTLSKIPVVGNVFGFMDEVVLGSIREHEQEKVNLLVSLMQQKLTPILEQLGDDNIGDEVLIKRLQNPEIEKQLQEFRQAVEARLADFQGITNHLQSQISKQGEQIQKLTQEVAQLGKSLDVGGQYKYIAEGLRQRINVVGSVSEMFDKMDEVVRAGQGVVYRCHRRGTRDQRITVVKLLKDSRVKDPKAIQRFLLEGYLSSQIIHENIVRVLDYGGYYTTDEYYIEMEDLGDTTLKAWSQKNPFTAESQESYLELIVQAINALEAIHQENLVHRDIKPSNFMVTENKLKLIDFGSVKSLEIQEKLKESNTLTRSNETIGTPQYMAPEQFDTSAGLISTATDIYGFGMTLYEILAGRLPINGALPMDFFRLHKEYYFPKVSEYNPQVPPWLSETVERMLAKKSQDRETLEALHYTIESHRKSTIDEIMEQSKQLMQELTLGANEELEVEVNKMVDNLRSRLAGSTQETQNQLKKFIAGLQEQLFDTKDKERQKDLIATAIFDVHRCPNLECGTPLQPGVQKCPQCQSSWLMPCVCEKKKETFYLRDICQKCRKGRKIPIEAKKKFALLLTLKKCEKEERYVDILVYCKKFAELENDSEISEILRRAQAKYNQQTKKKKEKILEKIEKDSENLLLADEKVRAEKEVERLKQLEIERQSYIKEVENFLANGEILLAYNYYRDTFPQSLKNDATERIREKICNELNQDELVQSQQLFEKGKYAQALAILDKIEKPFQTNTVVQTRKSILAARNKKRIKVTLWTALVSVIIVIGIGIIINNELQRTQEEKAKEQIRKNPVSQLALENFTFLEVKTYTCGGVTNTVKEYRHDRTGLEFVLIPGGTFSMGDNDFEWAKPVHQVTLSSFLISKTEVTQGVWQRIMGNNPSYFKNGDNYPVEQVSWDDCQQFCQNTGLQLPTEVQWEYACRAGTTSKYYFGNSDSNLGDYAWWYSNSNNQTHPVAQKSPNAFGLYDMSGNVWEWCADWYADSYNGGSESDPKGPSSGSYRVNRGGSWCGAYSAYLRSTYRSWLDPAVRYDILGFRCVFAH